MMDIESFLRHHPFCGELDDDEIATIAALASASVYPANTFVFRENDEADKLFLIVDGLVRLELDAPGGGHTIQTLDSDDALGLSWLRGEQGRWMFDAQVEETATVVEIDGPGLLKACERSHTLGYKVTRHLLVATIGRLQATRLRLLDLYR